MSPLSPTFYADGPRPVGQLASTGTTASPPSPGPHQVNLDSPPLDGPPTFPKQAMSEGSPLMSQSPLEGMSSRVSVGGMGESRSRVPSLGGQRRKPPPSSLELDQNKRRETPRAAGQASRAHPTSSSTGPTSPSLAASTTAPIMTSHTQTYSQQQPATSIPRSASQPFRPNAYATASPAGYPSGRRGSDNTSSSSAKEHSPSHMSSPISKSNLPTPLTGFPQTPEPSTIDRGTLVGVGELATPRWTAGASHAGAGTRGNQSSSWNQAWGSPEESELAYVSGGNTGGWNGPNERSTGLTNSSSARRLRSSVPMGLSGQTPQGLGLGILGTADNDSGDPSQPPSSAEAAHLHSSQPPTDRSRARPSTYTTGALPAFPPRSSSYSNILPAGPPSSNTHDESRPTTNATFSSSDSPVVETPPPDLPQPSFEPSSGYHLQVTPPIQTASAQFFDPVPPQSGNKQPSSGSSPLINHRQRLSGQFPPAPEDASAPPSAESTESERRKQRGLVVSLPSSGSPRPSPTSESATPSSATSPRPRELRRTPPSSSSGLGSLAGGDKERLSSGKVSSQPSSPRADIARHFGASHDFSHLPPSPSTSSIQQFFHKTHGNSSSSPGGSGGLPNSASSYFHPPGQQPHLPASTSNPTSSYNPDPHAGIDNLPSSAHHSRSQSQHDPVSHSTPQKKSSGHFSASFLSSPRLSMDPDTDEALRKLDGLGRSPSGGGERRLSQKSRARASLGSAGSGSGRSGSPPPAVPTRSGSAGGRSSRSRSSIPATARTGDVPANEPDGVFNVDPSMDSPRSATFNPIRSSVGASSILSSKRGSASSTSMAAGSALTAASSLPAAPPRGSSSGNPNARSRHNSNGSDVSSLHSEGAGSEGEPKSIPPVPPLPKGYTLSSRSSLMQLAQAASPQGPPASGGEVSAPKTPTSAGSSSSPSSVRPNAASYPAPTLDEMARLNEEDDRRQQDQQRQQHEEVKSQAQQPAPRLATPPSQRPALAQPTVSPKSSTGKAAGKKWSFSSALHIKLPSSSKGSSSSTATSASHPLPPSKSRSDLNSHSEPSQALVSPRSSGPALSFPKIGAEEDATSPTTPWSTVERPGSSPFFVERPSQDSRASFSTAHTNLTTDSTSLSVATSNGGQPPSPKSSSSRRLTPSSIPFFRRSSSSSMKVAAAQQQNQTPQVPPPMPSTPRKNSVPSVETTPASSSTRDEQHPSHAAGSSSTAPLSARKSMLGGMSLQGMLKSSSSRRSLAAQANEFGGQQTGGVGGPSSPQVATVGRYGTGARVVSDRDERKERERVERAERERERTERAEREKSERAAEKSEKSVHGRLSSMSLLGRRRGKTISSTEKDRDEVPISLPPMQMSGLPESTISRLASLTRSKGSPSKSSTPASSSSASASGSVPRRASTTVTKPQDLSTRASRANLPTIAGSPSVAPVSGISSIAVTALPTSSFHRLTGQTPTKIPRISSRNMGPPAVPTATSGAASLSSRRSSVAISSSGSIRNGMSRSTSSNLSEFGLTEDEDGATPSGTATARQYKSSNNDFGLDSAPLSRRTSTIQPSSSTGSVNTRPPRALPVPPSSSAAALTASAAAKKVVRESLPVRKPTTMSVSASVNDLASASRHVAPSPARTLTSKLSLPVSRIPSSSSASTARDGSATPISRSSSASPSVMDEDEVAADEEMRQFMKRQRAKKVASGATSTELEAMMNFPEPIDPTAPGTPLSTIKASYTALSDFERKEIVDYPSVYYIGEGSAKKPATREEASNNHGYDDERGDYLLVERDHLAYRYEVIGLLGKGSFGQVLQCRDHCTGGSVAVKIIRNKKRFHHQALVEVKILDNLRKWDPDEKHYVIRMTEHFYFRNHLCIATELLSINLYELIKANSFAGFTTTLIRRFTVQLLQSLILMRHHRIVHCDLKPENVLLSHPSKSGIKVIDFGSSCFEHEKVYTYIQSRFYRSPEVILGANYHMAIDMWSLGCILAELYTGFPIFPGENEQEQLSCIMEVLGLPDKYLIDKSSRKNLFFDTQGAPRPVVNSKGKRRRPGTKTLAQVLKSDDDLFVDFIAKCLIWDPERRLKPQPALRHPWLAKQRARASLQSPAPSVTGRILNSASSLASPAIKSRSHETPKKQTTSTLSIGAPTPLSARVRTTIGGPSSSSSNAASSSLSTPKGGHALDSSVSSTSSYRQRLTGHASLSSTSSARNLANAYGLAKQN